MCQKTSNVLVRDTGLRAEVQEALKVVPKSIRLGCSPSHVSEAEMMLMFASEVFQSCVKEGVEMRGGETEAVGLA